MGLTDSSATDSLFSWDDESGATQTLDVDIVMNATDKRTARLTDHVVETGAIITDHVVIQPASLSLDLLVTQTPMTGPSVQVPINAPTSALAPATYPLDVRPSEFVPGGFFLLSQGLRTVVADAANALLGAAGASGQQMKGSKVTQSNTTLSATVIQPEPADRVADVHDKLIEIMNNARPVTIGFKGQLYLNYLLEEIELTHAAGKFGCASFKVKARAFTTVDGTTVKLPDPADFRARPSVNKGNKPSKTPDPDPRKVMQSDLSKAADFAAAHPGVTLATGGVGAIIGGLLGGG